jgi:hypothetical protein
MRILQAPFDVFFVGVTIGSPDYAGCPREAPLGRQSHHLALGGNLLLSAAAGDPPAAWRAELHRMGAQPGVNVSSKMPYSNPSAVCRHDREFLVASHPQLPAELNQLGMHVSSLVLQLYVISPNRGTQ